MKKRRLRNFYKKFSKSIDGNVAIIWTTIAPVIIFTVGSALDYSLALRQSQGMQNRVDNVVLSSMLNLDIENFEDGISKALKASDEKLYVDKFESVHQGGHDYVRVKVAMNYVPIFPDFIGLSDVKISVTTVARK